MISISHIFDGKIADTSKPPMVNAAMTKSIKNEIDPAKRKKKMDQMMVYNKKVLSRRTFLER